VELYEAQISKMQRALERADQENSRLEQELRSLRDAQQQHQKGTERRGSSSLAALRDRVRSISGLATPLEQQAAERLQVWPGRIAV
jgi:predicted RNase H-like nuclease (RuvC/YqgF family)